MKGGYVRLNSKKIDRRMHEQGIGPDALYHKAGVAPKTGRKALEGRQIRIGTARSILEALKVTNFPEYLLPASEDVTESKQNTGRSKRQIHEWDSLGFPSRVFETSNRLQYRVYKMKQRHVPNRFGRGKCYELCDVPTKDRKRLEEHLIRHTVICDQIGPHPQIPVNEKACPDPNGEDWWVIDKWVDGQTLEDVLKAGRLASGLLPRVMRQIAEGLKVLHDHQIIRRELSPRFVLLRKPDKNVVLTDFELGKILAGRPTVRADEWPEDPYRAPEIGGRNIDVTVDLFSWGRIFVHAATGQLPQQGAEAEVLDGVDLPKPVLRSVLKCARKRTSERPKTIDVVLKTLRGWA